MNHRWLARGPAESLIIYTIVACASLTALRTVAAGDQIDPADSRPAATTKPAAATKPSTTPPLLSWKIAWEGWDGLTFVQSDHLPSALELLGLASQPDVEADHTRFALNLGGRLDLDAAAFDTSGSLQGFDNGFAIRRAQIIATGMFRLVVPIDFKLQLGYIPGQFFVDQGYLTFPDLDYVGSLKIGYFQPPMGLNLITNSRDIEFMEPSAPLQAMAPGNEGGIQLGHPVFDQRATWRLGIFGSSDSSSQYGNASKNYGNVIGRISWLPIDHLNPDHPSENNFLHVAISANYQYSTTSTVRYRSRPESYIAPYVIDTGEIQASSAATIATEIAWVQGPLTLQNEFIDAIVGSDNSGTLNFYGVEASVGWFLTDDSRPYNQDTAAFARVVPHNDFEFGKDGWGAFELACELSYTNLTDGTVSGGRLTELMGEANWYLQPHVRWMFGAGYGHVTGTPSHGDLLLAQTRISIDF